MNERSARLAKNEALLRAGNEQIEAVVGDQTDKAPNLCECGDPRCCEQVPLAQAAYEAVRSHPARFLVVPGQEDLSAGEVVVAESTRYTVVEKRGDEAEIVERTDPRASNR